VPINEGGGPAPAPIRQAQLRTTSALWKKTQKIERYIREGVIAAGDVRLIAIGAGRFGVYVTEYPFPMILSTVFPIGPEAVTINTETREIVDRSFQSSLEIERTSGSIPRTAFLDERFATVSGIIWSRAGIGCMARTARPLSLVHNPLATVEMAQGWGVWDREFVTRSNGDGWTAEDILSREDTADAGSSKGSTTS
jgi:hypothetical protein